MNGRKLVAWNLRRLRVGRRLSQEKLAADAGVDRAYMSRLERELENPTVALLDRLARALSAHISEFFVEPKAGEEKQVIDNVILATHLNVTPGKSLPYQFGPGSAGKDDPGDPVALADALSNARQGIPQGSAVASIAVEMLLAKPLKSLPTNARVVCYADNMLIMAKTKEHTVSTTSALWSALQGHPVGHLTPKEKGKSIPGQPFEFLGHQITRTKTSVNIVPTPKNETKFADRFENDLAAIANSACSKSKRSKIADDLRHFIDGWTASFSRCAGMADRKKKCLIQIQKVLALAHEVGAKKNLSVGSQPATL
jgi:transcriptional regulator with XRE-family HTH domain